MRFPEATNDVTADLASFEIGVEVVEMQHHAPIPRDFATVYTQNMSEDDGSRFATELELLQAMYPEQVTYDTKSRELKFSSDGALLELRIPEDYPEKGFPDVLAVRDAQKNDLREHMRTAIRNLQLVGGEEALDAIVASFQELLDVHAAASSQTGAGAAAQSATSMKPAPSKTVIIWLHHLLALSKRKLALSPTDMAGVTKPGYPGIMIFSGPAPAVTEHVNTLKAENWQAFQVRYEEAELWEFEHGSGIKEMETMSEVVKGLQSEKRRDEFLKAAGIK